MLYPSREDLPGHVPADGIIDFDVFAVDAPNGDFAGAMTGTERGLIVLVTTGEILAVTPSPKDMEAA